MSSRFSRVRSRRPRAVARLHERGFARHADGFLEGTDLERDGAQRQALGCAKDDAFLLVTLEALDADRQVERAGEQVRKHEGAINAGHGFLGQVRVDVLDRYSGAWHHAAGRCR